MSVFGVDVQMWPVLTGVERTYIAPEDLSQIHGMK
jgi:hypothetical protein